MKWSQRLRPGHPTRTYEAVTAALIVASLGLVGPSMVAASAVKLAAPPTTWSTVSTATPFGLSYPQYTNISCASKTLCLGPGSGMNAKGQSVPFAQRWNGKKWSVTRLPVKQAAIVEGVRCLGDGTCWLAGGTAVDGKSAKPLLLRWTSSKGWSRSNFAARQTGTLSDIACPKPNLCIAVGRNASTSLRSTIIAQRWDGRSWHSMSPPQPKKQYYAALNEIECPTSSDCLALGQEQARRGTSTRPTQVNVLSERFHNGKWSTVRMPGPAPAAGGYKQVVWPSDVSCSAENVCLASGYWYPQVLGRTANTALVWKWNGSYWSKVSVPQSMQPDTLNDVSCPARSLCWIVGASVDPHTTGPSPVAIYWNGGSLHTGRAAESGQSGQLESVGCVAGVACYSLGYIQTTSTGGTKALGEKVSLP